MNSGSDKEGSLRISLILIVFFLLFNVPISSLYGKDRFSSKGKDRIVVIDPGHGGKDWGAVGPKGAKEKNISLTVAILVKRELEGKGGFNVVLTRLTDRFIAIDERYRIANKANADCLISLHANGYFTPQARGIRTYYLTFLKDETKEDHSGSSRPSRRKGTSQSGENEVVRLILKDLTWTERINEGGRLARAIGVELALLPGGSHREVGQILSPVLLGAQMPACLVEVGFITNPSEEKRLRDRSYCKRLAKAMARGIVAFLRSY